MQKFKELKSVIEAAEQEALKFFDKDNMAAGTRLRKHMQDLKGLATAIRKEVTEKKVEKKAKA